VTDWQSTRVWRRALLPAVNRLMRTWLRSGWPQGRESGKRRIEGYDRKHVPTLVQELQLNRYLVLKNLRH
jgi:hypothetical protein